MDALFSVGWHKGEIDFAVRGDLQSLTLEQMNKWRVMVITGIGTAENMWRLEQERRAPAAQASEPPFDQSKHHPSCTPNDQDLGWHCHQCGHWEWPTAQASEILPHTKKGVSK